MMASNLLSRLLPSASDEPFDAGILPDERDEMDIDEENLEARFEAQDLENLLADASASHMTTESTAFLPTNNDRNGSIQPAPVYDDDDVPESLLLEGGAHPSSSQPTSEGLPPPVPGPSTRRTRAQWETARRHQQLHAEGAAPVPRWRVPGRHGHATVDPKERALWRWVNVSDLDTFLAEVYEYYTGCGIYSILLRKFLALLQVSLYPGGEFG